MRENTDPRFASTGRIPHHHPRSSNSIITCADSAAKNSSALIDIYLESLVTCIFLVNVSIGVNVVTRLFVLRLGLLAVEHAPPLDVGEDDTPASAGAGLGAGACAAEARRGPCSVCSTGATGGEVGRVVVRACADRGVRGCTSERRHLIL